MCVQSSFPESLKAKNRESDQYISEGKVWVDRCDCDEKYKTSGLNNTQHNTTQSRRLQPLQNILSCVHQNLGLKSRLQTVVFQARRKEHLCCCVDLESFPLKRGGDALEGRTVVNVSAVWLRDLSSNCVPLCFLDQGDFITKNCGAGDRLHQPACLLLPGWHLSWKVSSCRCVLYYMYLTIND